MPKIMLNSVEYTGGGGDSGMELTYNEYLALPEEEKTNGTTYYVKDINGVGEDQFQPIIYSEEEREIGVWIDGKPLYQKTIPITSNFSASMTINHNITNLDTIISFNGIAALSSAFEPLNDEVGSEWRIRIGDFTFTTFSISLGTSRVNAVSKIFVNLCYTKTTDQPGSGTWTPQGVPALHYSTDEQVVGTWIDGSTLYEKTYVTSTISNTTLNIDLGFPIGMGVIVHGYYLLNDSSGSMISANQWFASSNFSWTHIELNTHKLKCTLTGYTGIGYITIRYTKTTS